jgi:hypothetical protein
VAAVRGEKLSNSTDGKFHHDRSGRSSSTHFRYIGINHNAWKSEMTDTYCSVFTATLALVQLAILYLLTIARAVLIFGSS